MPRVNIPAGGPGTVYTVTIEDHPVDRRLTVKTPCGGGKPPVKVEGATIWRLSDASRRRMKFEAVNYGAGMTHLLTMTYPGVSWAVPSDGRVVKGHLNAFLQALRRRVPGIRYFWFLEFQARTAPHFHLFAELGKKVDRDSWIEWLSSTWHRIIWAKIRSDGTDDTPPEAMEVARQASFEAGTQFKRAHKDYACAAYIAKESAKMEQKEVPAEYSNVGRFWGVSSTFRQSEPVVRRVDLPADAGEVVASVCAECDDVRREAWAKIGVRVPVPDMIVLRGMLMRGQGGADLGPCTSATLKPSWGGVVDDREDFMI